MSLIPSWAPNVHPLLIHFPIVLILLALAADGLQLLRPWGRTGRLATTLCVLGAISAVVAFFTGHEAAEHVFTPGMAHPLVEDHEEWAIATTLAFSALAVIRVGVDVWRRRDTTRRRLLLAALTLVVAILVEQTAERGARLVFEQGVGVVAGPAPTPER